MLEFQLLYQQGPYRRQQIRRQRDALAELARLLVALCRLVEPTVEIFIPIPDSLAKSFLLSAILPNTKQFNYPTMKRSERRRIARANGGQRPINTTDRLHAAFHIANVLARAHHEVDACVILRGLLSEPSVPPLLRLRSHMNLSAWTYPSEDHVRH